MRDIKYGNFLFSNRLSLISGLLTGSSVIFLALTIISENKVLFAITTQVSSTLTYLTDKKRLKEKLFSQTVEKYLTQAEAAKIVYGDSKKNHDLEFDLTKPNKPGLEGEIEQFFSDRDLSVEVTATKKAPAFTRFILKLNKHASGKLLEPSDLNKYSEGLQVLFKLDQSPWIGVERDGVFIDLPNNEREIFNIFDHYLTIQPELDTPSLLFGVDTNSKPVFSKFSHFSHLLLAGETNSGKTSSTLAAMFWMLYWYSPEKLNIWPYDSQKGLSFPIKPHNFPHFTKELTHTHADCVKLLEDLTKEADRREKLLLANGVSSWTEYQKLENKSENLPYLVAWLEELLPIISDQQYNKKFFPLIIALLAKVRKLGIGLVMVIQTPSKRGLPDTFGTVRDNVPAVQTFRLDTPVGRALLGNIPNSMPTKALLGAGDSLLQIPGLPAIARVQGYFLADSYYKQAIDIIGKRWQNNKNTENPVKPEIEKFPTAIALSLEITPAERGRILETWRDFERLGKIPSKETFVRSIYNVTKGSSYQPWINACDKIQKVLNQAGIKYPSTWFQK